MNTRYTLLGLLARGPSHGYDLKRRHDKLFPQSRPLAYGQVYKALKLLVRDGLAKVEGIESGNAPDRTTYHLTKQGTQQMAAWTGKIAPPVPFVTNEIFTKVVVAILADGDPAAYIETQRAAHIDRIHQLTALKANPRAGLATLLSADYALNHLGADLSWMIFMAAQLTNLTAEVKIA